MHEITQIQFNIIYNLLTPNGIRDPRIIHAFQEVSRETFLKYPVDECGEKNLLSKLVIATMLQALSIKPQDRILVIGSINLFLPALLSFCCKEIFVLTNNKKDEARLKQQNQHFFCNSIKINCDALQSGLSHAAPFKHIIIEGGANHVSQCLRNQIILGGNLIYLYPLDNYLGYYIIREHKTSSEDFITDKIKECSGFMLKDFNDALTTFEF